LEMSLDEEEGGEEEGEREGAEYYEQVRAGRVAEKARKSEEVKKWRDPKEVGRGREEEEEGGKRGITYEMAKNAGIKKKRTEARNPRIKNKLKYQKAIKKRASQVQKPRHEMRRYQGEASGIKTNVVKSRHL